MGSNAPDSAVEEDAGDDAGRRVRTAIVWVRSDGDRLTTWLGERAEVTLGSDADCDVKLDAALISPRHARLKRTGSAWFIEDLASRAGVRVNGEVVTDAPIANGDVIRIGGFVGMVLGFGPNDEPVYELIDEDIFGGPDLRNLFAQLCIASTTDLPVVLEGPTGTGKEQFARAIHRRSGRTGPFLAINCSVYRPATAAAELFGYRKGAFAGAERANLGLIRAAEGGTLLLDQITDLPLDVQPQLLRVIENHELIPFGESQPISVNVRFLAATQQSLGAAGKAGRFRADLRGRLEGLRVTLPPLAARRGDIPFLFLHLLRKHSQADPPLPDARVLERLCLYAWPLNVRELVSLAKRTLAAYPGAKTLSLSEVVKQFPELDALGRAVGGRDEPRAPRLPAPGRPRRANPKAFRAEEVRALEAALLRHQGNVAGAAAELGFSRQRAYRMLKRDEI